MADILAELASRLELVRARVAAACGRAGRNPGDVTIIGVTKTVTAEVAGLLIPMGIPDLGESRPQEIVKKHPLIPLARWHLIGHLQRNKIDAVIPLVALVHSVDSDRVLAALDAFGRKRGTPVPVLLEVNCSREAAKGGFRPEDLPAIGDAAATLPGVRVDGLMTMAAYSDDPQLARPAFVELRKLRDALRTRTGLALPHLSMGMTGDFEVAIEEGATLIRPGSVLFSDLPGAG